MSAARRPSTHRLPKRHTPNRARQGAALGVTGVVSLGMVMAGAGSASAAETPVSQSRGYFLSGSALGTNLDNIVALQGARAKNYGGATVTQLNPLSATVLNSIHVPVGPINLLGGNGLIQLGAVNQAAIARASGSAVGASGAVTNSGAIAVDGQSGVPASNATLDLGGVLSSVPAGVLNDVDLNVGALAASAKQARGHNGTQTGDYRIAQLTLSLKSPLLASVLGAVPSQAALQSQVEGAVNTLGLVGGLVTVSNLPNLAMDTTLGGNGPVSVNVATGAITVNVEALLQSLGLDLNNLPPNTELMPLITNAINTRVAGLVNAELSSLSSRINTAFQDVTVSVAGTPVSGAQLTAVTAALAALAPPSSLATEQTLLDGPGSDLLDPAFAALAGVLSLEVNVQERANHAFTERALVIRVLPGASPLVRLNLASASVGPGNGPIIDNNGDNNGNDNGDDNGDGDHSSVDALPHTGAAGDLGLGVAGLAMIMAGTAAASMGRSRGRHARS